MKIFLKSVLLLGVSAVFLYLMSASHLINWSALYEAFLKHPLLILTVTCFQIGIVVLSSVRYYFLLKALHVHASVKRVFAANVVGNGLGQWFPGSLAFIEAIRLTLMLGRGEGAPLLEGEKGAGHPLRSKLAAAALWDRILGYFAMILVSVFLGGYVLVREFLDENLASTQHRYELLLFVGGSFCVGVLCLLLPLFAGSARVGAGLMALQKRVVREESSFMGKRLVEKILFEVHALLGAVRLAKAHPRSFIFPLVVSFFCVFFMASGMFFSAYALETPMGWIPLLASVSLIALASIFPLGWGGIGGVQLVAAVSLGIFGVSFEDAASAQLLQTAVNLVSISLLSLFFLRAHQGQIVNLIAK